MALVLNSYKQERQARDNEEKDRVQHGSVQADIEQLCLQMPQSPHPWYFVDMAL